MNTDRIAILVEAAAILAVAIALVALRLGAARERRQLRLAGEGGTTTELAASLEPDDVLDRTLDAIVALPDVDAAFVAIGAADAVATSRSVGLTDDEVARALPQMPSHPGLRAIAVSFLYPPEQAAGAPKLPRTALTVPLRAYGEPIGSLSAISRSAAPGFSPETVDALDALARRAGPALSNAQRYSQAREQADFDSLTGLYNRRLFYESLAREIARAQRYERTGSLIVFDLDDFKRINDRIGHLGGDAVLVGVADCVRSVVRATDIACRVGGDEFAVIVPESGLSAAELLASRIGTAIRQQTIERVGALKISVGVVEFRPDETASDLFKRADDLLYRAKNAGRPGHPPTRGT